MTFTFFVPALTSDEKGTAARVAFSQEIAEIRRASFLNSEQARLGVGRQPSFRSPGKGDPHVDYV